MYKLRFLVLALASAFFVFHTQAVPFADAVVNYVPGTGFAPGFVNAASALGEPSRVTTGVFGGPVDPFNPPYLNSQLVSVGSGGSLTVQFNSPISNRPEHLFGLDLIVFGNNGFTITNNDFAGGGITDGSLFTFDQPGSTRVFVSADNAAYFELVPPPGTGSAVDGLFPTDGSGDFERPVDPELINADFAGLTLAGIRAHYAGSGGGAGFDLAWAQTPGGQSVSLNEVNYVRVEVASGRIEIDGFAAVPEPAAWALGLLGLLSLAGIQISRNRFSR